MTPEERQMLREALDLSRENSKIVHKIWRSIQWGRAIKVVYWLLLLGIAVGAFYFIQPYIDMFQDVYGTLGDTQDQFRSLLTF